MKLLMAVLFNLKPGVTPAEYEKWAHEVDRPNVKRLGSVDSFRIYRAVGSLGEGKPAYSYMELIEVRDFDELGRDAATETMQKVGAQFQAMADNPQFILLERFA